MGVQPGAGQFFGDGILGRRGFHEAVNRLGTFGPVAAHLGCDVGTVAVPADEQRLDVLLGEGAVRSDHRGIQEPQQFGKGFLSTVVRGGRREDQRLGVRGEHPRQLVVLGAGVGEIVGFVDDHGVPLLTFQMRLVARALERVDRDDGPLEVREWVAGGGQFLADLLDAGGVRRTKGSAKRHHSSCCICSSTCLGVTTRMRSPRPRRASSERIMPISMVLPRPTASAMRMRGRMCNGSSALVTAARW